ncbi:MAG: beta-ketoacyl synthase N-terminal-like domain-containing protein [Sciscionella sp.]
MVPDFDIQEALGTKGTGSMDRATALAVATTGRLLDDATGNRVVDTDQLTAIVLGTTSGSARTQMDFTRATLTRRKPYLVEPSMMPFALMNSAAGQCAIRHQIVGPNSSLGGGRVSGLLALSYAARLLASGRASTVVCGSVEEFSPDRALLESSIDPSSGVLGEGCAVFLIEPSRSTGTPLAEVLMSYSRICVDGDYTAAFSACLRHVLSGVNAAEVWAIALSPEAGPVTDAERQAVDDRFRGTGTKPRRIRPSELIGDTGAAAASFQTAALLSIAEESPEARGKLAIVTSAERDGSVACALLRMPS